MAVASLPNDDLLPLFSSTTFPIAGIYDVSTSGLQTLAEIISIGTIESGLILATRALGCRFSLPWAP